MIRHRFAVLAALACVSAGAGPLAAQQPTARQVDSLGAEIRALKVRLDSVRTALTRATAQGRVAAPARDTAATDELAALRTAARAATGRSDTAAKRDTTPTRFIGRERNQAQLNPEISVTGDVRAYGQQPGIQRENFDAREFEVGFQSALDPYSHTKIFISLEGGHISVEEGYAYWTGLPGHTRLDVGKYRQQFGELNRWHLHAVPETEYPLAITTFLGEDGLSGTGLSLYRAFGGLGTHELTAQATRSASDSELFGNSGRPTYKLNQRFILGARYDYVESPDFGVITRQFVPSLTLWQSEWVFLRAQYQWQRVANATANHQIALQAVWAIGPHKHETY